VPRFLDLHCPAAMRILDFPHAAEHMNHLLQAVQQAWMDLPADLLPRLTHDGPRLLLCLLQRLLTGVLQRQVVRGQVGYVCKREAMIQYPHYHEQG
jgi:hypothetical protein